jgi:hypothetical protein
MSYFGTLFSEILYFESVEFNRPNPSGIAGSNPAGGMDICLL